MFPSDPDGASIRAAFLADEPATLERLAAEAATGDGSKRAVAEQAAAWIEGVWR